jgi:ParB-like chromosome segregation protein Spo0J
MARRKQAEQAAAQPENQISITYRDVDDIFPDPKNVMDHSEEQIKQIAFSIEEFGFTNPILIDENKVIIAGHGRLLAAKMAGIVSVPTIQILNLSEEQKRAYMIADNKLAREATWNEELLFESLSDLKESGFDVELTGFMLDDPIFLPDEPESELDKPAETPPEKVEFTAQKGKKMKIGKHKIPLTPEEYTDLTAMVERYAKINPSLDGFGAYIVSIEKKLAAQNQ